MRLLNYEYVKSFIKDKGYELLDTEFHGVTKKLTIKNELGYYFYTSYNLLKNGERGAPMVHPTNIYTLQNIKLWCHLNNKAFELQSDNYISHDNYLEWKCLNDNCGEIFKANWSNILTGNGCSYCSGRKAGLSNCLATKNPELAKEWHPTKNGNITPSNVTCGSSLKAWWKCKNGHEWEAQVYSRTSGNKCPYCAGLYVTKENNLLVNNPKLCEEWNYDKNNIRPEELLPNVSKKVWWKCRHCQHEWCASINNRNKLKGRGCPKCNKSNGENKIREYLCTNNIIFFQQKKFKGLLGVGGGYLSYDFYLPDHNLLIEYQGEYHIGRGKNQTKEGFKKQQEHDKRKREYAINNNIRLFEIWYWDLNKVDQLLKQKFIEIKGVSDVA